METNHRKKIYMNHLGGHFGFTSMIRSTFDFITEKYEIKSILDVGCGPAGMVEYANYKKIYAIGIDGDPDLPKKDYVSLHDFANGPFVLEKKFDLVYLETDGKWYPVTQATADCSKLLGICAKTGIKPEIILEGTITVNDSAYNDSPTVQSPDHGLPIYIRDTAGNTMSTNVPTTAGQYVRILGHAYYQNTGAPEYWIMKFRPSNEWYVI